MSELEFKDSLYTLDTLLEMINKKSESIDAELELLNRTMRKVEKIIKKQIK